METNFDSVGKSRKNKIKSKKAEKQKQPPPGERDEDVNPIDFGGMPSRDLKKNLGCG